MAVAASKGLVGLGFFKPRRAKTARVAGDRVALLPIVLLGCGLVVFILAHVWLRLQVVNVGYELSTTSKLQNQLEQENRELKVELATLTSPERLEATVRSRLGMVEPATGQVVILP